MPYTVKPNGDIVVSEQVGVVVDEKLRARHLHLDLPADGGYMISFDVESQKRVEGFPVVSNPQGQVTRVFPAVMAETQTITDPVTGQTVTISVAGVAAAIQAAFTRWLLQDHGA